MSHTSTYDTTTFVHNGDPRRSDVTIIVPSGKGQMVLVNHQDHTSEMNVPYDEIEKFVLDVLRNRKIAELEDADDADLTKLLGLSN